MKTEDEMKAYLEYQGVSFTTPVRKGAPVLRLRDATQVPEFMREQFDETGYFIAPKVKAEAKKEGKK